LRAGHAVSLTAKEFALLEYFLRNPERVLSRAAISEHVWDARFDSQSNVIDVYVNMLRKKIEQPGGKRLIQTAVGFGYVLREEA
jgi:two-component system, OmpR family, copper resistance phosphate regulon response regulator CusR